MAVPARKEATYEDLFALPPHVNGEIVNGELTVSPRPRPRHTRASTVLGAKLANPFDFGNGGPGGWLLLIEPELHFAGKVGTDIVIPDLAGWRRERLPQLPEEAFFRVAPDWICEVLSPSTARFDKEDKLPVYARAGVAHAWLIDPEARTLDVYACVDGRWVLLSSHGGDALVRPAPFEAASLELAALWT